jgi:hypothetical protein
MLRVWKLGVFTLLICSKSRYVHCMYIIMMLSAAAACGRGNVIFRNFNFTLNIKVSVSHLQNASRLFCLTLKNVVFCKL